MPPPRLRRRCPRSGRRGRRGSPQQPSTPNPTIPKRGCRGNLPCTSENMCSSHTTKRHQRRGHVMTLLERTIPNPPVCPNGLCGSLKPETAKNRLGISYPEEWFKRHDRCERLQREAELQSSVEKAIEMWVESLAAMPNPKSAAQIAKRHQSNSDALLTLAFEGLAYALNPRQDQGAIRFAELLYQMGEFDRSADIVCETLNRNESYEPAWKLKQRMEDDS